MELFADCLGLLVNQANSMVIAFLYLGDTNWEPANATPWAAIDQGSYSKQALAGCDCRDGKAEYYQGEAALCY